MALLSSGLRWPWQKSTNVPAQPTAQDPVEFWRWIDPEPFGQSADNDTAAATLNWFVPPIGQGSGGHLNIFRFIKNLEALGFDCRIIVCNDPNPVGGEIARQQIAQWFMPLRAPVYFFPQEEIPSSKISLATGWQTAFPVRAFRGTRHRCYFVQDFEPWFYSPSTSAVFAEETYRFGFLGITAGDWLAQKLNREFGMKTVPVGFSYDRELYRPLPKRDEFPRVFFYARPPTPRRAFDLGMIVLAELAKRHPDVGICIAGWDLREYKIPFPALSAGQLSLAELPDLYSQCNAALVFSLTNASLLPLELMACGCVVVSNRGPNVEWLLDDDVAVLTELRVESLVQALEKAIYDKPLHDRIVQNGLRKVGATSWVTEAEKMAALFRGLD